MQGILIAAAFSQSKILIPMDLTQTDHLKAYGIAYWALTKGIDIDWLLNYRGGSFMKTMTSLRRNAVFAALRSRSSAARTRRRSIPRSSRTITTWM
jgi:hypothetical protein